MIVPNVDAGMPDTVLHINEKSDVAFGPAKAALDGIFHKVALNKFGLAPPLVSLEVNCEISNDVDAIILLLN